MQLDIAFYTHTGKVRADNEDAIAVDDSVYQSNMPTPLSFMLPLQGPHLLMVADGMGGHQSGEVASQWLLERLALSLNTVALSKDVLTQHLQNANLALFEHMTNDPTLNGMGSTLVGLYCESDRALLFNIGDSRAYRVQDGFLAQLSSDDTYDNSSFGDLDESKKTGRISQAFGGCSQFTEIDPHVSEIKLIAGDTFLLCSDGLTDMLSLDDMEAAVDENLLLSVQRLFDQTMDAGGNDNISILIVHVIE